MMKLLLLLIGTLAATLTPAPSPDIWAEPVPYFDESVVEQYLAPASEYGSGHRGVDFIVAPGQTIHSPDAGAVHFVGRVVNRELITIRTQSGQLISFEPVCSFLTRGEAVSRGQSIGTRCSGTGDYRDHCHNCVHASVRDEFGYLSPMQLFGRLSASVLLS